MKYALEEQNVVGICPSYVTRSEIIEEKYP